MMTNKMVKISLSRWTGASMVIRLAVKIQRVSIMTNLSTAWQKRLCSKKAVATYSKRKIGRHWPSGVKSTCKRTTLLAGRHSFTMVLPCTNRLSMCLRLQPSKKQSESTMKTHSCSTIWGWLTLKLAITSIPLSISNSAY